MNSLHEAKIDVVRTVVARASDEVVSGLCEALIAAEGDTALAAVRRVVEAEVADRRLRNRVLEPIAPLFVDDAATEGLRFPRPALSLLWRGLRAVAPEGVERAASVHAAYEPGISTTEPFDELVACLAQEIEEPTQSDIASALDLIAAGAPGGREALRVCLAVAPVVRRATLKLPEWIGRTTQERAAAARLAYRDACRAGEAAGPCFFEMLGGQLAQRWTVLRIVSAVMDHPSERYLSGSELAIFATRLIDANDEALRGVSEFDLDDGPEAGARAAAFAESLTRRIAELEDAVELARDGEWGARVHRQKLALAAMVERRLRELPKLLKAALPVHRARAAPGAASEPLLESPPEARAADRCGNLLGFAQALRGVAAQSGFAAVRSKAVEEAAEYLDRYVEDVLALVKEGEVASREIAEQYLKVAAGFAERVHEPRSGDIVRRRAALAFAGDGSGGGGAGARARAI